jgi:hypothetical protein
VKQNINSVEVHPQLSNNRHPVDGALAGAGSMWRTKSKQPSTNSTTILLLYQRTRGVSHDGLAIYIKKYLKAKEELWKLKYFTMQEYNLQKNPLKENQKPFKIL